MALAGISGGKQALQTPPRASTASVRSL
jgi:hypothetical protein